jgi:tRNA splicing endonuclease
VFKQQNAIHGPPLQLCKEEITLLLEKNLAQLAPPLLTLQHLATTATTNTNTTASTNGKRKCPYVYDPKDESYYDEEEEDYNFDYYEGDDTNIINKNKEDENQKGKEEDVEPAWQGAIANGTLFNIPTTAQEALNVQGNVINNNNINIIEDYTINNSSSSSIKWNWPSTEQDLHCYLVFRDLHSQGFRISGGSKFGADFLLYPGDISLYHAQFCVRVLKYDQAITPSVFSGILRGTHQARKHLLMASVVREEEGGGGGGGEGGGNREKEGTTHGTCNGVGKGWKIHYITVGPVDGFGTS